ncbi:MAG: MFS transporter, partial [Opitutaceae bacterium]|nr:MFS transporter [Opitutaceae bacterium]
MSDLPSSSLRFFAARRFFPLFLTQLLGAFNDNVLKCAFTLLATFHFSRTHGWNPAISTQLIAALFVLPFFLFSAHAGQLADKFDKARLVVLAKIWELLAMALGSAALLAASPWLLAVTLFLLGAQAAFFGPLKYALLPQHLRENELLAGNALVEAATYIAILAGTVAGGRLVLDASGNPSPLPVCVILLTCSLAGLLSALRIPPAPSENPSLKLNPNLLSATAALLKNASRNGPVFRSILGISWFWLIGAFWLTLTPAFVSNHLRGDAGDVTALLLLFALGIGAGSLLCNKLLRGEVSAKFVPLAGIAGSLFMADAAVLAATLGDRFANGGFSLASPAGLRLSVDLAGIAVAGGVFSVPLYALMQRHSAPTHRSRMVAANNILNALFMAAAAALAAALFA